MILITYIRVLTRKRLNGPYVLMLAKQRSNSPKRPQRCALAIEPTIDCSTFAPTSLTSAFALFFKRAISASAVAAAVAAVAAAFAAVAFTPGLPAATQRETPTCQWIEKISLKRGCRVVSGTTATKESPSAPTNPSIHVALLPLMTSRVAVA